MIFIPPLKNEIFIEALVSVPQNKIESTLGYCSNRNIKLDSFGAICICRLGRKPQTKLREPFLFLCDTFCLSLNWSWDSFHFLLSALKVIPKNLHIFLCKWLLGASFNTLWFITECCAVTHSVVKLCHRTAGSSHLQLFSHSSKTERQGRWFGFSEWFTCMNESVIPACPCQST